MNAAKKSYKRNFKKSGIANISLWSSLSKTRGGKGGKKGTLRGGEEGYSSAAFNPSPARTQFDSRSHPRLPA